MEKNAFKRKKLLVDRRFQYRLVAILLSAVLLALFIFTALTVAYYWISSMYSDNVFKEFITIHSEMTIIEDGVEVRRSVEQPFVKRWELIVPPIIINNLLIMLIVSILGIVYSHRIAGPAYRIKADVQNVLNGDDDILITLRKGDALHNVADSVNRLLKEYYAIKKTVSNPSQDD